MTALRLRDTLTGVRIEHADEDGLRASVAVLGRRWAISVTLHRIEDHAASGFGWWAWAEGCLLDGPDRPVVGVRVGPVGMPSRRSAIRDALTEALSQLRASAWLISNDDC